MTGIQRRAVLKSVGIGTVLFASGVTPAVAEDDEDDEGEDEAGLRVAHASPDAPAVDVLVDGTPMIEGLAFSEVTDYLEVPAGEYEIAVNVAGTDTTVFGPVEVELEGEDYTAVARGEVTSDDTDFTVSVFEDTNGANLDDDEVRVRAVHASPDAPAVDVTVDDDALTLFDDLSFGESSGYTIVPAGTYEVEIRPAGGGDPVFEVGDVTLVGGSTYTVFAVGYLTPDDDPTDEEFGLVVVEDASAPPRRGRGDEDEEDDENRGRGRGRGRGDD